ncbi:ubiquinol-cytochrome C chaperone family protein [Novosphingobium sp. 9]|uniref:ubiquinol-cytochrome C chaperone family protein n=1 Tax=Novosphingobium sp. 9 TaxID=2025349 RepID=UPI0021B5B98C|nr:ubiquinol-cytochrome C chaperone family protein [Novosphingobium sp. 9]
MSLIQRLFSRSTNSSEAMRPLWLEIIAIARNPDWYSRYGIADSVAGRFDALVLVLALVMLRMERDPVLIVHSVHLTELFVEDIDGQLRQSGVGDLVVGKRMGELMRVLGGRTGALRNALPLGSPALVPLLGRNVTTSSDENLIGLADAIMRLWTTLDRTSDDALISARIEI